MDDKYSLDDIERLAHQYKTSGLNEEEQLEFDNWYNSYQDEVFEHSDAANPDLVKVRMLKRLRQQIQENDQLPVAKFNFKWSQIAVAASVILIAGLSIYYFNLANIANPQNEKDDVAITPGKSAATLTLANGKKIVLSDESNGKLTEEAGVLISKNATGQLVYEITEQEDAAANSMNVLSTADGETYLVKLSDGTKVWLNAATQLKYPATFSGGGYRKVELNGEAYFEVVKNKKHPFIVQSGHQIVEVLGTRFNVNAYEDEPAMITTLAEGSVRLNRQTLLKPGEQGYNDGNSIKVSAVDTELALAWVQDELLFEKENLASIMKKVSKWYSVEVNFQSEKLKLITFSGRISRKVPLQTLLRRLSLTKEVKFKTTGRLVTVQPYK